MRDYRSKRLSTRCSVIHAWLTSPRSNCEPPRERRKRVTANPTPTIPTSNAITIQLVTGGRVLDRQGRWRRGGRSVQKLERSLTSYGPVTAISEGSSGRPVILNKGAWRRSGSSFGEAQGGVPCPVPEQLCGVQLVPQTIGYRGSLITRSESPSSRQKTPIAASVAAPGDTRHC